MTEASSFLLWLLWLAPAIAGVFAARGLIHYFQLSSYQVGGYWNTIRRQARMAWLPGLLTAAACLAITYAADAYMYWSPATVVFLACVLMIVSGILIGFAFCARRNLRKPLHITGRVIRLSVAMGVVLLLLAIGLRFILPLMGGSALILTLLPLWLVLAAWLVLPLEKTFNGMFMRDAIRILNAQTGLVRIGITGSYGKTSVKFILRTILHEKYPVLATRLSFNTPMGITRSIREDLRPEHRIFIAEMGARHPKDIKELCDFVKPQIGILTAVGEVHLETFGTIERVKETKYDLIRSLPNDGLAVFYDDGGICRELYERTDKQKLLVGSIGSDAWAEDVELTGEGSSFTLCLRHGERAACQTALPGEHNIRNILLAAATAHELGLNIGQIQRGIAAIQPVESRIKPEKLADGRVVINNGFNTNPDSSKESLAILKSFPGRHIVVTPGYVEMGKQQDAFQYALGQRMAQVADLVLLIGPKRTKPIMDGMQQSGFAMDHVHVFGTLQEANEYLASIKQADDVILYENDLPDQYTET